MKRQHDKTQLVMVFVAAALVFGAVGCLPLERGGSETTETYRAALVSEDDVTMEYAESSNTRSSALNGETSGLAALTAKTVHDTNHFLRGHLSMMRAIVSLPPAVAEEDRHIWEGSHDGLFLRLTVERTEAEKGTRFVYRMEGRPAENGQADMLRIFGGHVVRTDVRPQGKSPGWGVVRFFFGNLNTLQPERQIGGRARIAFRRVGGVKQVRVRLIDIEHPDHPNFPAAAAYRYTLGPNDGGVLRWFGAADFNKDGGTPLERLSVHSRWRDDRSGVGVAFVFGGTMEVENLTVSECWDTNGHKTYGYLGWPGGDTEEGDRAACRRNPDDLDTPAHEENLADEDPEIPAEHPDEASPESNGSSDAE